jgi:streptogramin lyase
MLNIQQRKVLFGFATTSILLFSCRREIPLAPGATETESFARAATAVNLNPLAGQPANYPVSVLEIDRFNSFTGLRPGSGYSVAIAADANNVYHCDTIRNGIFTTPASTFIVDPHPLTPGSVGAGGYADGPIATAKFLKPTAMAIAADGTIYVCDAGNNRIRVISADHKTVSTLAGDGVAGFRDGVGTAAEFNHPYGIALDANGTLYISDRGNNVIRRITNGNTVTRWCGQLFPGYKDASGSLAQFNQPWGITVAPNGAVYVADYGNNRIRKIVGGIVSTFAGNGSTTDADGTGTAAGVYGPSGVSADSSNNVYVSEALGRSARLITPAGQVSTLGTAGRFNMPGNIHVDRKGRVWLIDGTDPYTLTNLAATKTVLGAGAGFKGNGSIALAPDGTLYFLSIPGTLYKVDEQHQTTTAIAAGFSPGFITCDASGNIIVLQGGLIKRVTPAGAISTFANPGEVVNSPSFDAAGNLWVSASGEGVIFKISPAGTLSIYRPQGVGYYRYGVVGGQLGWIRDVTPAFDQLTVDKNTGNVYVGYGEAVYRFTPGVVQLTLMYGGNFLNLPAPAIGQIIKSNGVPLNSQQIWIDGGFNSTGLAASPSGKLYITNRGFDFGYSQADIRRRYNLDAFDPNTFGLGYLYWVSFYEVNGVFNTDAHDAAGPDTDGPTDRTTIGAPWSPVVSADGKVLYFVSVQAASQVVTIRKTSAL